MVFHTVLVPTDLSEYSLPLQSCVDMYRLLGVQVVHLFHVQEKASPSFTLLHHHMEIMAETFRGAGIAPGIFVEEGGDPTLAILKKAREVRPDLIHHGLSWERRYEAAFLGQRFPLRG